MIFSKREKEKNEIEKTEVSNLLDEFERNRVSDDVLDFIKKNIDSFIDWDIIIYFYKNSGTRQTLNQIAINIGRNEIDLEPRLRVFVKKGLLGMEKSIYFDRFNQKNRLLIKKFINSLSDRTSRIILISLIIQKESAQASSYKFTKRIS